MRNYLVEIETSALGDNIGAIPCIEEWRRSHGQRVFVRSKWKRILKRSYPNLVFVDDRDPVETWDQKVSLKYRFDLPLQAGFASQLGFDKWNYIRPKIDKTELERPIKSRYVTLGIQSTAQAKYWNRPGAWDELCRLLRKEDLTPVCVDQYESFGIEGHWNLVPSKSVKRLDNPIEGTINYIQHAEFHIGISSGLSWVAHAAGKRVVLISGVTERWNEFEEDCLRIIDESVCHGCINHPDQFQFRADDWLWCPVHRGTDRQFECTKVISPELVMSRMKTVGWV